MQTQASAQETEQAATAHQGIAARVKSRTSMSRNRIAGRTIAKGLAQSRGRDVMATTVRRIAIPGVALIVLTTLISGVSNFVNAVAVQHVNVNADAFVAVRNAIVALLLVPLAVLLGRRIRPRLQLTDWLRLAVIGLIGGAIPFLLFFRGLQLASQEGGRDTATFGYRTLFLMATALGVVALKERFHPRFAFAAGLLLTGNVLLLSLWSPIWTDGTAYVLLATGLWAGEYTLSKHTLRDLSSSIVALGRMGFGGVFLLAYVGVSGQFGAVARFGAVQWEWLLLSALLLVGFVTTWYAGLKTVDLSVAASVLVAASPITSILNVMAGQAATITQTVGLAVVAMGAVVAIGLSTMRDVWDEAVVRVRYRLAPEGR